MFLKRWLLSFSILLLALFIFPGLVPPAEARVNFSWRNTKGVVVVRSFTEQEGRKRPHRGFFQICQDYTHNLEEELSSERGESRGSSFTDGLISPDCWLVGTNRGGVGVIYLEAGYYTIYSPYYCPPGMFCLAGLEQVSVIFPNFWTFNPTHFYVRPLRLISITALKEPPFY